ncbi:carboxypeptidase regulatory-like domain-containing protein [Streptomyces gibsoniae]|uniref:Carboxypeptidase regulatory-like domain-containing protein n=1 Tax=Streptomyces gibsoniae TaxID=3075529 RepID=A0ABU2U1V3_9ACTN|nr:carboxypeptidase regulatory-like domain-containing protein [Streptomyces sp. DSM 41699]MDT0467208.1 carboxypeptidase regulatory-like domain-containing protein [Streptomyces sp. DSM 41699]
MPRTRPRRSAGRGGRAATAVVGLLSAALAVIGLQLPTAAPASAASSGKAAAVRQCADPKPGHVTCLSLHRTDVAARRGVQAASATPSGFGAIDLRGAYALPADGGAGQTVAIVDAYDDPTAEADLAVYRRQYGLPACTTADGCFTKVDQRGGTHYPSPDASWAGEMSLDLDMVSAAAPNAHILLVEADSTGFADMGAAVDEAVALGAKYVSNSYGTGYNSTPGTGEDPAEATEFDPHYNHPGVAMVASSGDSNYGVGYPASSQYVTAVGGTSLVRDSSARGWSESVWSGAGSGCSLYETKPAWQSDSGCAKRTVADVAAVADPATGVAVYDSYQQGGWSVFGGTSAAAPIIAGVYAAAGTPVKDTYPASYPYANPGHLNDVTAGRNGSCSPAYLCTAGAGYDGPTGLGTPNGVDAFTTGPHGVVTGTVTDASTKAPLSGATVKVGDSTALTDASGQYHVSAPVGTYDATASAYGYADKTVKGVTVTDGGSVTEDFALDTVPSSTVSGKVTDGSGHPWPLYATITATGVPGGPVHTDPYTGRYSLKLPQGQTYTLNVSANYPGYEAVTRKVTVGTSDTTADLSVPVDPYDCVAAGYTVHNTGTTQTFDGTSAPDGWTLDNTDAGGWAFDDPQLPWWSYSKGNHTGGSGGFAVTDTRTMNSQHPADMSLVSPVTDFSGAAHPDLTFSTDLSAQSGPIADVEVTTDGGTTWKPAWSRANDLRGPAHVDVPLPMAAHQSAVQVRFHFSSRLLNAWWQVDDVHLGDRSCDPVPGGLVAGTVTDANTGQPVLGATVTSADKPAEHTMTAATPDDPNLSDGFYWMFSSLTGTHDFTAERRHYTSATAHVDVAADAVTRTPFTLKAGRITVTPGKVGLSVPWQGKAAQTVTVKNTGSAPAKVTFGERAGGVTPLTAHGAPTTRIKGSYSPLRLVGKAAANRRASGAAPHAAVPADAPWTAIADYLPGPVVDNAVVSLGGKIYSAFGTSTADFYRGMYVYDPTAGTWSREAGPADGRQKPAMAVLNGKIYATGGWGSTGAPDGKTEVYDPAADAWTTAAANPRPLAGSGTAVLDGKMYVVGGCDTDCGATDVMAYDPATDSWSRHADYPEAVSWEACGALYGELYCAGGTGPGGETQHTYVYDPAADSWSRAADLPIDLYGSGYTTAEGRLLVSGGVTEHNTMITNQGFSYDPAGDTWTPMANSNNATYRGGSACGFYKIGGIGKDEYGDLLPVAGAEVLPGVSDCGDGNDVSWLAAKPKTVTVAPGASATVTVTVDASATDITQPGTYTAKFAIGTDTPYSTPVLPVSMTVAPPKTWGKITGVVTGSAGPLPGAVVQITTSGAHYTITTDASGHYQVWADARNPLQVICADDGYQSQMTTVRISKGGTTTLNFALQKV